MTNNDILQEKLTALGRGNGFIVFAIDEYYVQFSCEYGDLEMYVEAVSHNFVGSIPQELSSDFKALGFAITNENYHKKIDKTSVRQMVKETEQIFRELYKVDYTKPFEITENIC